MHFEGVILVSVLVLVALSFGVALRKKPESQSATELPKPEPKVTVEASSPAAQNFEPSRTVAEALKNTEQSFWGRLRGLFDSSAEMPDIDSIEEVLYTSDLGPKTVVKVLGSLEDLNRGDRNDSGKIKEKLREALGGIFSHLQEKPQVDAAGMKVLMVVGVNGAGKTTSIGKLAAHAARSGKKVMVVAGDTFRAAAANQLRVWTERAGVEVFSPEGVTDPAAVTFDALTKALAQGFEFVIVDTAGRLHTSAPLMEELKKVKRIMSRVVPEAPHEVMIVLDANSGQNALIQAREFHEVLGLTGVVLTKLDGTAKGGVAFGIVDELQIPIRWIGIGEKLGDLKPFNATEFVDSILPPG